MINLECLFIVIFAISIGVVNAASVGTSPWTNDTLFPDHAAADYPESTMAHHRHQHNIVPLTPSNETINGAFGVTPQPNTSIVDPSMHLGGGSDADDIPGSNTDSELVAPPLMDENGPDKHARADSTRPLNVEKEVLFTTMYTTYLTTTMTINSPGLHYTTTFIGSMVIITDICSETAPTTTTTFVTAPTPYTTTQIQTETETCTTKPTSTENIPGFPAQVTDMAGAMKMQSLNAMGLIVAVLGVLFHIF